MVAFDRGFLDGEVDIAWAIGFEQGGAQYGEDGPVGRQASTSAAGMPPLQVAFDVLQVFGLAGCRCSAAG
jgi:hypothetical protein